MLEIFVRVSARVFPKAAFLGLGLGSLVAGSGCGNCDGAVREMVIRSVQGCGLDPCVVDGAAFSVGTDASVRIVGDGPNEDSDFLLEDSGISAETFFLIRDDDGERIAATLGGDAGGHTCRNGVGFGLEPDMALDPGKHTVVLLLEDLAWPVAGGASVQSYEGKDAFVRSLDVIEFM